MTIMKCTFVSATEQQEEADLDGIFAEAVNGALGILAKHAPLIAKLKNNSQVRLESAVARKTYTIGDNSFLRFAGNEAVILTSHFSLTASKN